MWGTYNLLNRSGVFSDIGLMLKPPSPFYDFEIVDEKLFFLSSIKYGITYKHTTDNEI